MIFAVIMFTIPATSMADVNSDSAATATGVGYGGSGTGYGTASSTVGDISPTQSTTVGGQTTEVGGQTTTVGGQTTEVGGQETSVLEGGIDLSDHSVNEAADLSAGRAFANPGSPQFGPVINYFGQPLPSSAFQPVEQIIMYSCWYSEGALESMLKGVEKVSAEFKVANPLVEDANLADDGKTRWIKVLMTREKYLGANFKGFVTARSENPKTTMVETMAKAALEAMKNGCNVMHFTSQGAVRDVSSFGWGIGFNTTAAEISKTDNSRSNITSGGFGVSSATAGTRDKPWLQGFGLVDPNLVYPDLTTE